MVSKGRMLYPEELPSFAALQRGMIVGLAMFRIENEECEVVTLNSLAEGTGIGSLSEIFNIRASVRRLRIADAPHDAPIESSSRARFAFANKQILAE